MRRSNTPTLISAAAVTAMILGATAACDWVDVTDGNPSSTSESTQKPPRRYGGRTLLVLQPARAIGLAGTSGTCRVDANIACSLDKAQTYQLLGGPSRVSLVDAEVVQSEDGFGVQARFATESQATLDAARQRAVDDGTLLLVVGNGNRALLVVPVDSYDNLTGRLVATDAQTETEALAVIAALSNGA